MLLSESQRHKLRSFRTILLAGIFLGMFYVSLSDGFGNLFAYANGLLVSFTSAILLGVFELYIFPVTINKLPFVKLVITKTNVYFLCFIIVYFNALVVTRMIKYKASYGRIISSEEFVHHLESIDFKLALVFIFLAAFLIIVGLQIARKLGGGTLTDIVLGKYRKPQKKYRLVMFLRIQNADKILERIGMTRFYYFLNDYYFDIAEPLIQNKALIYQYSNEETVLAWSRKDGFGNAKAVRLYFAIKEVMSYRKEHYIKEYGFLPGVSAGIHSGEVVIAEIGDLKIDIVFHGDVINTTARILEISATENRGLLISYECFNNLDMPVIYEAKGLGTRKLKGKEQETELFEVLEKVYT